jgi:RNA polymerase sigma-70 factor, ECF subfamily
LITNSLHNSEKFMTMDFGRQESTEEFSRLYRGCEEWLYHYLLSLLRRPDDAEEVLQETAKLCWEKFDLYQRNTEFRAWACRIAYYKVMKFREKRRKTPIALSDLFLDKVNEEAIVMTDNLDARLETLDKCLAKLSSSDRKLLHLRYAPNGTSQ